MPEIFNKNEQSELIVSLNQDLSQHRAIFETEILERIRQVKNPILVDIDGTVIYGRHNYELDNAPPECQSRDNEALPGAQNFLESLRLVGTVIFVTHSYNWDSNRKRLTEAGLWDESDVLLTIENFFPIIQYSDDPKICRRPDMSDDAKELIKEFDRNFPSVIGDFFNGLEGLDVELIGIRKALAPVFGVIDLPMVENSWMTLRNNPGIFPLPLVEHPSLSHPDWEEDNQHALSYEQIYLKLLLRYNGN